jgi:hypothetical protein
MAEEGYVTEEFTSVHLFHFYLAEVLGGFVYGLIELFLL